MATPNVSAPRRLLAEQVDNSKAGGFEADNTAIALELEAVKAVVPVRKLLFWFMSFSGKTKDPSNSAHDLIWPLTTSAANKKGKDMPGGLTVHSLLGRWLLMRRRGPQLT